MATRSKFDTVLPNNTIQQGLNYTPLSSVYANNLNTMGQAENVMCANDVELSLNCWNPGSTASISIPASYKLLGNMYLKLQVKLSTLLAAPIIGKVDSRDEVVDAVHYNFRNQLKYGDSATYKDICTEQDNINVKENRLLFSNVPPTFTTVYGSQAYINDDNTKFLPKKTANGELQADPYKYSIATGQVGTGSIASGLPLDVQFLAYNLIRQFTWRIPGCDRCYISGLRMLATILDKCPTDDEKQKIAMMSGSGHHLYSYNMTEGTMYQDIVTWRDIDGTVIGGDFGATVDGVCNTPTSIINYIKEPTFTIYALLDMPWSTVDKDRPGLYYPSHMTTSALELNIQFQDKNYMQVLPENGYSGYKVDITNASLRFTYAAVSTLTYYKPPVYKLPCSLHYEFQFPVKDYGTSKDVSVNLQGLKNGEITQLLLFLHQSDGNTASELGFSGTKGSSMRYKWRNEPLKNLEVQYAGQIIWKGKDDAYDFMNQFDNRKSWSSFKFGSIQTMKSLTEICEKTTIQNSIPVDDAIKSTVGYQQNMSCGPCANLTIPGNADLFSISSQSVNGRRLDVPRAYVSSPHDDLGMPAQGYEDNHQQRKFIQLLQSRSYYKDVSGETVPFQLYDTLSKSSLSNGYDISSLPLSNLVDKEWIGSLNSTFNNTQIGSDLYQRSLFDGPYLPSAGTLPVSKINYWHTMSQNLLQYIPLVKRSQTLEANTQYYYGDIFHWTTIPISEKIDQIRGPRDYNLGADFKDSNLTVYFKGMDAMGTGMANEYVKLAAAQVRWDLHCIVSITSAFIFNGDRAELMQ